MGLRLKMARGCVKPFAVPGQMRSLPIRKRRDGLALELTQLLLLAQQIKPLRLAHLRQTAPLGQGRDLPVEELIAQARHHVGQLPRGVGDRTVLSGRLRHQTLYFWRLELVKEGGQRLD